MTSVELDIAVKLIIGIIGAGSGIITWFARVSFEEMKKSLEGLIAAVNSGKVSTAVLETRSAETDRRLNALEHRVESLESEARQIREG